MVLLEGINEMKFRILFFFFTTGSFYCWDIFVVWFCLLTSLEWLNGYGIPVVFSYHKSVWEVARVWIIHINNKWVNHISKQSNPMWKCELKPTKCISRVTSTQKVLCKSPQKTRLLLGLWFQSFFQSTQPEIAELGAGWELRQQHRSLCLPRRELKASFCSLPSRRLRKSPAKQALNTGPSLLLSRFSQVGQEQFRKDVLLYQKTLPTDQDSTLSPAGGINKGLLMTVFGN